MGQRDFVIVESHLCRTGGRAPRAGSAMGSMVKPWSIDSPILGVPRRCATDSLHSWLRDAPPCCGSAKSDNGINTALRRLRTPSGPPAAQVRGADVSSVVERHKLSRARCGDLSAPGFVLGLCELWQDRSLGAGFGMIQQIRSWRSE